MANYLGFETYLSAYKIINELALVKPGETVAITADTLTEEDLVNYLAGAVVQAGGKPLVLWYQTPDGTGKAADPITPYEAMGAAIGKSDVWIEIGFIFILFSRTYEIAFQMNPNLRHVQMAGLTKDMANRLINKLDFNLQAEFQNKLTEMTRQAKWVRITNPSGTELTFRNHPGCPYKSEIGIANKAGSVFTAGQIAWFPDNETINGTLVFDGALNPPCGVLQEPIRMKIVSGHIDEIAGGEQATSFKRWLEKFHNRAMYRLAHVCYGFNAGARIVGNGVEDERVWGSTEWGLGYLPPEFLPPHGVDAPSHCDGVCLNSSVWLDGVQITEQGTVVHPELKPLADRIYKSIYR